MIAGDAPLTRIFNFYKEETRQNVIKLLLRVIKMYTARNSAKDILFALVRKEEYYVPLLAIESGSSPFIASDHEILFREGLRQNSKIVHMIRQFREEHKIFKAAFIFKDTVSSR
jgi:hypothetical protein